MIISIWILAIVATAAAAAMGGVRGRDALVSSSETIVSALTTARANTLAARGGMQYGVHFASTSVTIFPGSVWSATLTGTSTYRLIPGVEVSSLTLNGGPQVVDIVFDRLTGKTARYGTTTLRAPATGATSTIMVESSGSISSRSR